MKKIKVINVAFVLLAVSVSAISCKKDEPTTPEVKSISKEISKKDVTDYTKWYYFSFETGDFVGVGEAEPEKGDDTQNGKNVPIGTLLFIDQTCVPMAVSLAMEKLV